MASQNWIKSLEAILHHEGGYVNHPKDPGGETNLGVTKRVYEDFGGTKDMKELIREDVEPIYKKNYWDRVKGDNLPAGLDLCVCLILVSTQAQAEQPNIYKHSLVLWQTEA